jgi:SynChlorMet cassette radical SAM/SPASM protein ScmF
MSLPADRTPPLRSIYLYLTGSCNLNCRHCWIDPAFETGPGKYLPWSDLKGILEQARDLGLRHVKVTGGEPFLHPEICEILPAMKAMDLDLGMETNGTLIKEKEARALKEAKVRFSVSLDGPSAEVHEALRGVKGCFEKTLQGIEALRREGLRFQIIFCLYRKNQEFLPAMVSFARDLGAHSLKINPITGMARSDKMKEAGELLSVTEVLALHGRLAGQGAGQNGFRVILDVPAAFQSLREISSHGLCSCGVLNMLGVLHNGRAGLCGIGEHVKALDFGNLLDLGVRRVWEENEVLLSLRQNVPQNLSGICGRCMLKRYCLGKCLAQTYCETGDLFQGYPFCEDAFRNRLFPETRLADAGSG